jgi:septum formation protein
MVRLILASASPRREQLLRQLGLTFRILPGTVEETAPRFLTPSEMVRRNARNKACAIAQMHPEALVLGADTIVCLRHTIFGKPAHFAEAQQMLRQLQGQTHQVITGVCLMQWQTKREKLFAVTTHVTFRSLNNAQIDQYLSAINPLDKAGAYAIQEQGELIVERIDGSYTNVVGLPVERLRSELAAW